MPATEPTPGQASWRADGCILTARGAADSLSHALTAAFFLRSAGADYQYGVQIEKAERELTAIQFALSELRTLAAAQAKAA